MTQVHAESKAKPFSDVTFLKQNSELLQLVYVYI
jgi:hypothetical protein